MASKKYNRYFIIFQEEDKGFGIAIDKQPTGYTKIETRNGKCKITVYVQNLIKGKGPYICCMIDSSKNPAVVARLGEISVDETGRGETWWEYDEEDIAGTKSSIEKFIVAAVIVEGEKILSPLAGYASKEKIEWRDKLIVKEDKKETEEKEEIKEEVREEISDEARKFKEYEEKIRLDIEIQDSNKDYEDKNKEEKNDTKEEDRDEENDIKNVESDYDIYDYAKGDFVRNKKTHAKVFNRILDEFEEKEDLCQEIKGCRWWKIPFKENYNIPQDDNYPYYCTIYHPLMAYPYINYIKYIKKKGYYYFGLKYDDKGEVKAIIYGIEGALTLKISPIWV
ncbi:hypothetical protein FDN13_06880 [Caloramator sp. E03]|uniref:DUF7922 domain-containing protein n=1 Tax=Caloramator sp. E03 TaxID=2576307 RepID=UPI0011105415|nr:hypothetical protein [Caloramator sp. E03]QCX33458.1 hypothetical protein FDN13_06880 [Caloramator sp. E03]